MSIVSAVADRFRSAVKTETVDRYGVLQPLLACGDYISATSEIYGMFKGTIYADFLSGKIRPANAQVDKAVRAYKDYVKGLPGHEQSLEKAQPFSTILLALESINGNIVQVQDAFPSLFGNVGKDKPETELRSSSLIIIGYLEKADAFATWLGSLVEHMTATEADMIPPFRSREMLNKAAESAEFAAFNLHKWNYRQSSLLNDVKAMQKKGADLAIQTAGGAWIDEYAHDDQFTPMERELITASLRSSVMIGITYGHVKAADKIELLSSRKEWLTSKMIMEQSKMRGLDESSPEYKRLKKAVDYYAGVVSRYEQKIERMRA